MVHLPGKRDLIIDSKAVLQHYVEAANESDPVKRGELLKMHAAKLRDQISLLARKEYHAHAGSNTVEFTVLFLPSDPALSAALAADEKLFEKANKDNIILASPNTLMALLKVVEKGWRDAEMAENAEKIANAGKDLMNRFRIFWDHLGKLRNGLASALGAYNDAVGSLEKKVIPGTRKLMEMGVQGDRKMSNKLKPEEMVIEETLKIPAAPPPSTEETLL